MAVYTAVDDDDMRALLSGYDIGPFERLQGIQQGVENSNWFLDAGGRRYVLTVYEKRVDPADLPYFLNLMEHLTRRGIRCPEPVHDRSGRALVELAGKPAAIFTFLPGRGPGRILPAHCRALGTALAELHLATADFTGRRPNALALPGWQGLAARIGGRADEIVPGLAAEIADTLDRLAMAWPTDLPAGTIHADLFPDNVFYERPDRVSGLIDFYFACSDAFAYEIAICINAWCFEPDGQFNVTKARLMLGAYRKVRPFSEAELAALPLLCEGAALRFLLTRAYDWLNRVEGALVKPKDPLEYLHRLRFHRSVTGPGAYGLD